MSMKRNETTLLTKGNLEKLALKIDSTLKTNLNNWYAEENLTLPISFRFSLPLGGVIDLGMHVEGDRKKFNEEAVLANISFSYELWIF